MALFSRKNRPEDDDNVRLTSSDHAWWTGEVDPQDQVGDSDGGEDTGPEPGVADRIAEALEEYGYVGPGRAGSVPGDDGPATGTDGAGRRADLGSPSELGRDGSDDAEPRTDEAALFVHDGLPSEDRLSELLGTLGLEGDADWVDIARAHRRLVGPSTGGRLDGDNECQRRAANEAYACLRLFHH